ncbi:MAG: hypothetical protein RR585_07500, partial [Coprobacillus sp.]
RTDIFHDPKTDGTDECRKPYRYNLDDRPSLYLASTVHCCCGELGLFSNKQMVIGSMYRINPEINDELFIINLGNRPIDYIKKIINIKKQILDMQNMIICLPIHSLQLVLW